MKVSKTDFLYLMVIVVVLVSSYYTRDNIYAVISSVFGTIYTILLGKGKPQGYIFGMVGTICGSILAFSLSLWGNFMLHACFFLPMEIIGLIQWNKNLNKEDKSVIKTQLDKKEGLLLLILVSILTSVLCIIFTKTNDGYPYLDSLITVLSLLGMYLTVKRCYEQWLTWTVVNSLSVIMWFEVFMNKGEAFSVLLVRLVYLFLGIYFFFKWRKDINTQPNKNFAK